MNVEQLLLIILFVFLVISIIKSPVLKIGKKRLIFDYGFSPLVVLMFLGLLGFLSLEIVKNALVGSQGIVPWQVIFIFFSKVYICMSVDSVGVFEYFSYKIISWTKGNKKKLFFGIVLLSAVLTIFTSNDIVILTMTPIICYLAIHAKINPFPYLFGMFFSANTWSMLFYIGNPPNIIIAQALDLTFLEYAKLMVFPTVVAGTFTVLLTYLLFKHKLKQRINVPENIDPNSCIKNRTLAIIKINALILFFVSLATAEYFGSEVWEVSVLFFGIYFMINLFSSFIFRFETKKINFNYNNFFKVFRRVPWKMFPLIISLFIIIELFNIYQITLFLTDFLNYLNSSFSSSIFVPFISAVSSNLMVNQPTSILFGYAITSPSYLVEGPVKLASGLGTIIGTNLGGNLTLFGALAGLLWKKILDRNNIKMTYMCFLRQSIKIILLVILITSLALYLQIVLFS